MKKNSPITVCRLCRFYASACECDKAAYGDVDKCMATEVTKDVMDYVTGKSTTEVVDRRACHLRNDNGKCKWYKGVDREQA